MISLGLLDNSLTNQLSVSQVMDWSTRQQQIFTNHKITTLHLNTKANLTALSVMQ